jgi:transcriptional regulator with XRE-family HTH domain
MLHCDPKARLYNFAMHLGERIRKARLRLKMTQKELAAVFGLSEQAVSNWERGKDSPGMERMPQLRQVLRVNYAWLHEGAGEPPAPDALEVVVDDMAASAPLAVRSSLAKAITDLRNRR